MCKNAHCTTAFAKRAWFVFDKTMRRRLLVTLGVVSLFAAAAQAQGIDRSKIVDLSYTFNKDTIYWPNAKGFVHRKDEWKVGPRGYWYAAGGFSTDEHGGTHFDSPIHFGQGKMTLDQIPVSRLIAPAAVIDISAASAKNRDYRATPQDIQAWEKANGQIAPGTIVVFRTGWGKRWPNKKEYLGDDKPGDIDHLHFPGISKEAAELLVTRKVDGVGIDTASMDYGASQDFIVHQVLDRKSTRLNSSHIPLSRMPSSA